ncbi:MAG: 3-hydroxyacyl-CoA dehydrogenase [Gammaproteobacteria bacterium]|nr:MAG: 3-hydroxyacyl-CoA dehydrogenase [Gammaproteobacteria bacterium]
MNLSNHHAVVTGGATGIGLAITKALYKEGARVTIMGRNKSRLNEVADTSELITAIEVDISNQKNVEQAFKQASTLCPISILINNAGAADTAAFHKTTYEQWQNMLAINLTGSFLTTQAALADIKSAEEGRIINIASTAGLKGYAYTSAYTAAKHGIVGLTRSLALELSKTQVTVNAICPGFTNTAIVEHAIENITSKTNRTSEQALADLVSHNPQKRLIEVEEVAQTVLWLCHANSQSITGQSIIIAGGELM